MSHRILVVTYFYPPDSSVGSHRWASLVRHLRGLGHDVTVLTTSAFGELPDDGEHVLRTRDVATSATLRRLLRRPPLSAGGVSQVTDAATPRLMTDGPVPDAFALTWLPFVAATARRLLRRRGYDCLVTCSGPHSTQLLGLALPRLRPAWIADFEEGWRFEPLRGHWPTKLQDLVDRMLEAFVIRSAECVTSVAQPIAADFHARFGVSSSLVPMAWDPSACDGIGHSRPIQMDARRFNLVYTGGFSHVPERRDPTPFVAALRQFAEAFPDEARHLSVVVAGAISPDGHALLQSARDHVFVQHLGSVSKAEAVALQRHADALLLIATGRHVSTVTGKLHEYLAADRPIIALASENEAARIVRSTRTGVVVAPGDVNRFVQVLRDCVSGRLASSFQPTGLTPYRYPAPAHAFLDVVEEAIAIRQARQPPPRTVA